MSNSLYETIALLNESTNLDKAKELINNTIDSFFDDNDTYVDGMLYDLTEDEAYELTQQLIDKISCYEETDDFGRSGVFCEGIDEDDIKNAFATYAVKMFLSKNNITLSKEELQEVVLSLNELIKDGIIFDEDLMPTLDEIEESAASNYVPYDYFEDSYYNI